MNNQDKKKDTELKCLNTAIRNCLSQKGDSKRIGSALRMAYIYYAKKEPVVLDLDVERTLEILFQHIISWRKCKDDNWSYEPIFLTVPTVDYIDKAFDAFDKRWNLDEILDQDIASIIESNNM